MRLISTLAALIVATGLLATPALAVAGAPDRLTVTEQGSDEVWATCGPGDELRADYVRTQTVTAFGTSRATLHLQLVGTLTRTGTGVVGKYVERQRDFEYADGSEQYVGLLGHLVVPGGGGFTFAGQAVLGADGTLTSTPGLVPLLALDDDSFVATVCDALAGWPA
jgi:hypothetical protein